MFSKMMLASQALLVQMALASEPNPPIWDLDKVKIISPGQSDAQSILDKIHKTQGGNDPECNGQFTDLRYAVLFEPGTHNINVDVGYYTTIHGLGKTPQETTLTNLIAQNGLKGNGGALDNFWRSVENLRVKPSGGTMTWAVSQAAPLRRLFVEGNLNLFQGSGYSSGGFMSDSVVTSTINSGSQQQFMFRNSDFGQWKGGAWNMVFVGTKNAPQYHCGHTGDIPATTVDETPLIIEKPYIVSNGQKGYSIMVPGIETNKVGTTKDFENAFEIPFSEVYVAKETDTAEMINKKLEDSNHLVFQPGNYHLTESIVIKNPNTVVIGMGMATLISTTGKPCIQVANVDGVKISGLLLQAGTVKTDALLKWGQVGYEGTVTNPGAMHDLFARVGGPDQNEVKASSMVQINSGNVIIDDTWLWRADHDVKGNVANKKNPVDTGLQINGDNVIGYGLACEHTLGNMLEWNGDKGKTYFYQSEYPYDVDHAYADAGFVAYKVGDSVTDHEAWGVGVYSFFRDYDVNMDTGISSPQKPGIKFHNSLNVFLDGKGGINHVINEKGGSVHQVNSQSYVCEWPEAMNYNTAKFLNLDTYEPSFIM